MKNAAAVVDRSTLAELAEKKARLRRMQKAIPGELAEAEARHTAAKDSDRLARQDVIRIRALAQIDEALPVELRAAEQAALRAAENLREAEDQVAVVVEKLPALAAAYADTIEAYRVERLPGLRAEATRAIERIDRAWSELLASFDAAGPLAEELRSDWKIDQNTTGHIVLDARVPFAWEGLLSTFFQRNKIALLAEKWKNLRARG